MQKKLEINRTKIKGSFQWGRKVASHDSKSDLPLVNNYSTFTFQTKCNISAFDMKSVSDKYRDI